MNVRLIDIDVNRDAVLVEKWLNGPYGVTTLRLMGMVIPDDWKTSVEKEINQLQGIIDNPKEIAHMVEADHEVVGIVEAHLEEFSNLPAPNISIMLGSQAIRGKGVGYQAQILQLQELRDLGFDTVYSRVLTTNIASNGLLAKIGFIKIGNEYTELEQGEVLHWQNYRRAL